MDTFPIIQALCSVASILSPAHANAVSHYLMDALTMESGSSEQGEFIMAAVVGLLAEFDQAAHAAERFGQRMVIQPVPAEIADELQQPIVELCGDLRMIDGFFHN